ncbi:MAG: hypothetical protein K2K13_07530 [Clostridiales bacterium]|nr:hypothetical protein [Clostridiales bacterium]MDE6618850.1 hypothetical protein [Clostridiales bacterium]
MSFKKELAKEIKSLEEEIKQLEIKRSRSQASIIDALISKQDPEEQDVQFFRTYSAEIELKREQLAKLNRKLETL